MEIATKTIRESERRLNPVAKVPDKIVKGFTAEVSEARDRGLRLNGTGPENHRSTAAAET